MPRDRVFQPTCHRRRRRSPTLSCCTLQIEADLRFCEDVLNGVSDTSPELQSGDAIDSGSNAARGPSSTAVAQHQPPDHSKQGCSATQGAAKACTYEDLLHMLNSVPEGQPFEIDTRLLFSPQSSFAGGATQESPEASSCSYDSVAWEELMRQHQMQASSQAGSPARPPYQPAPAGDDPYPSAAEQDALAALWIGSNAFATHERPGSPARAPTVQRSQQHACDPPPSTQQVHGQHRVKVDGPPSSTSGQQFRRQPSSTPNASSSGSQHARRLRTENVPPTSGADSERRPREDRLAQLAQPRVASQVWQQCAAARAQLEEAELQVGQTSSTQQTAT